MKRQIFNRQNNSVLLGIIWGGGLLRFPVHAWFEGSEFIVATVPSDAVTGPISVTTPGGTVTSTKSFTVK